MFLGWSQIFNKKNYLDLHFSEGGRDSGNDFPFPNIALHTGRFCLIISYVVSFWVDIGQLFNLFNK